MLKRTDQTIHDTKQTLKQNSNWGKGALRLFNLPESRTSSSSWDFTKRKWKLHLQSTGIKKEDWDIPNNRVHFVGEQDKTDKVIYVE